LEFATIKIKPLTHKNEFVRALAKINSYDWIIFTSGNGVAIFFEALQGMGKDARVFGSTKVAAIGSRTAAKLNEFGIRADFMPSVFTSEQLGKQLPGFTNLQNKKVLLMRSELASNELVELLAEAGARVDNVSVYTAEEEKGESAWLTEEMAEGTVDWMTFTSPSSVDGFFDQIPCDLINKYKVKVASIGPVTSERLKELGVAVDVTATEHTIDGLLDAIEEKCKE
jgi:uroporphyrinogen III methyltransferase/synthase